MSKRNAALAGVIFTFLLAACGSREPATAQNAAAAPEGAAPETMSPADPSGPPANGSLDPVPPPDAISHPDGYLPPAPAEPDPPGANSSDPPATEDEYMRNRQSGR